ncbi:polysaccharide lyase family 8 super-sandwich domain-containing protein [Flavobacterium ajazii]|uniref:polysaccharide lyase family 8 super-sandwich domain-containing protein n=1 Tax=Flavobacterium ajazii TaxID=2692318 RepID=UPI0013D3108B|nr:polysaccharide lyase family 8 super-sandwich domain-containing protein [Flavobacterium ajazii]
MKYNITLLLICLFLISNGISAQITIDGFNYNWARIENTTPVTLAYTDADNGDGLNDGATLIKGTATTPALQGVQYTLGGSPLAGEQINLEVKYYQNAASYARFKMQVYNVTDNLVLSETAQITTSTGVVGTSTLAYTFTAASVGDQIIVRFVRADDLNTVRVAALDYLKVNGEFINMIEVCKPIFNFDLPLTTATTAEINDLAAIRTSLSNQLLGTTAPTTAQLNTALAQYDALNITVTGTNITGNAITDDSQISFLKMFARYLKFNPTDTGVSDKAAKAVWYIASLNCSPKSNSALTFYSYPTFSRGAIFLNSYLPDTVKAIFGNTLYQETELFKNLFDVNYDFSTTQTDAINTDTMYLDIDVLLAYADWFKTNDEKIRYLKTVKRFLDRFLIYTYGTKDGLKKDGLGYHHNAAYDGYMYAYNTVSVALKSLEGTGFQIDQASYLRFRDAVYAQTMYSNDSGVKPFAMAGRNPQSKNSTLASGTLANTAISGGKILGLSTADPVLSGIYNRKYGVNSQFNNATVAPFEEGFIQFNYGNLGIYRKNNWVASMKGQSDVLWGSEIYINQNRFGRYQSYGALEIIYPGNSSTGNGYSEIGWDWNYNPGATTIVLPWDKLHAEKERVDEYNTYGFAGSLALNQLNNGVLSNTTGQSGLFSMKFKERNNLGFGGTYGAITHNATFEFTKTYFAIDNFIICLASGIKNDDTVNPTVTTLFQRLNNNTVDVLVNGDVKTSQSTESFVATSPNWIIDNYNTGYYILPNSGTLKIKNSAQTTPYQNQTTPTEATIAANSSNNYHLAYLDHGNAPTNSSYEFVCLPLADSAKMTQFALEMQSSNKPYTVYQNNTNQQIIEHKGAKTWAYALPAANTTITNGLLKANDTPCLVMYKGLNENFSEIVLSVSNPDMGAAPSTPKVITLKLSNEWNLSQLNSNANIVSATATETTIAFTVADGLPVEIKLALVSNTLKIDEETFNTPNVVLYPNPVQDYFNINVAELQANATIRVYNVLGNKVREVRFNNVPKRVFVGDLSVGTYFVVIQNGGQTIKTKIIKK